MNISDYDIYHLGLSGGKDSTAVLLWIVYESGWSLDKLRVTFCDTSNEDGLTYAFLNMLRRDIFKFRLLKCEYDFWELAKFKKRFPSRRARFCTQWLKIIPAREYVLDLQRAGNNVLMLNGVRRDEGKASNGRSDLPQFGWDDGFCCDIFRPAYEWSIGDIWAIHKKHLNLDDTIAIVKCDPVMAPEKKAKLIGKIRENGIPRNPLYDMGAKRVGCFPCINSAKEEIRLLDEYRPERVDFIESQEGQTDNERNNMYSTFFARNTVPLPHRSKEITTASGEKMMVATIRDVVQWSKTAYGGKQYKMELDIPAASACDIGGMCE